MIAMLTLPITYLLNLITTNYCSFISLPCLAQWWFQPKKSRGATLAAIKSLAVPPVEPWGRFRNF